MVLVQEVVAATAQAGMMGAVDAQLTTIESPRLHNSHSPKQVTAIPFGMEIRKPRSLRQTIDMHRIATTPIQQTLLWRVRTVARPLRRYGDETTTAIPYAMLVVSNADQHVQNNADSLSTGLYHKLHGVHRPVQMKKSEIKRRKRVVPALSDQNLVHSFQTTRPSMEPPSVSPDPSAFPPNPIMPIDEVSIPAQYPPAFSDSYVSDRVSRPPMPVDFTDYIRRPRHVEDVESQQLPTRKRSFSQTEEEHSSAGVQSDNIDPSLSASLTTSDTAEQDRVRDERRRDERRLELQREAARFREMLEAKERELADLD